MQVLIHGECGLDNDKLCTWKSSVKWSIASRAWNGSDIIDSHYKELFLRNQSNRSVELNERGVWKTRLLGGWDDKGISVIIVEVLWIPEVKERTTIKGMTKEVIIDLRSWYANTLLTTFITASATPIIRSSPYHEILVCRWLVGWVWFVLLQMWWKVIIQRSHIVSTWSRFHYLMKHDRITDPSMDE